MNRHFLDLLCCPYTKSGLELAEIETQADEVEYGILRSEYSEYPIIAGIPILFSGQNDLLSMLKTGRLHEATALAVFGAPPEAGLWRLGKFFQSTYRFRRLGNRVEQVRRKSWVAKTSQALFPHQAPQPNLKQLLSLAYHRFCIRPAEVYNYNYYRFLPRYFTAMSFVAAIQPTQEPVLDLACGAGHLLFQIHNRTHPRPALGLDGYFFSLYVAHRFIAPGAWLVCGDINMLPFRDAVFSTIFCSDAFDNFSNKWACVREMERTTTPSGDLMLVHLRNKLSDHLYSSRPLSPTGYRRLVQHLPHRAIPDHLILQNYFEGKGLPASAQIGTEILNQSPKLSIWARKSAEKFTEYGVFQEWPHARGKLYINPLYQQQETSGEKSLYTMRFPSEYYREENPEIAQYMPKQFDLTKAQESALQEHRTQELEPLIQQWAILNLPPAYFAEMVQ